ncbi:LuxR C-terminal-related transcriptional regulator [Amycolatopsis thermoflava]|uniref:AAA ATPase-like protein n=1 Tax=Amycolatopsis thermoflava TaxID=84480 RepID=A0A3N2H6I8_9PSEU|nr:AAA family ATPase [Amycolatopsis thermoflava]ROS44534.1 AAA ATPase-like protein [Amycolatopsis thermoflava]
MDTDGLVGRERERAALERALSGVHSFAVVRGEPGAGKSTLLDAAAAAAGVRVLRAAGVEAESQLPFAGLHQLLLPLLADGPHARDVLDLMLGSGSPPDVLTLGNAVIGLLAAAGPVFVAVDDGHWFDQLSAQVCAFVFRRVGVHGVRGAITLRTDVPSPFDRAGLPEVEVGPLAREEAEALLDRSFPGLDARLRQQVLTQAEGIPLALLELPRTARHTELQTDLPLSRRLEGLYAGQISELTPSSRRALLLAALDGLSSLSAPRRRDVERRLRDVDEAIGRGLLLVDPVSGQLGFRHPLVRSAVVQLATPNERRAAHAELAEAHRGDIERRATHLSAATIDPDEQVAAVIERAALSATRRGAATLAIEWLERAAELSEDPGERERRFGEAAFVAGQSARLQDAQRLLDASGHPGSVDAVLTAAYAALYREGDVHATHQRIAATVAASGDELDDAILDRLLNLLLAISQFAGDPATWTATEQLVDRFADRVNPHTLIHRDAWGDVVRRGAGVTDRLRGAFTELSEGEPWDVMRLTVAAFYVDALDEFRPYLRRMVEREGEAGAVTNVMTMLHVVMLDQINTGQWADAEATGRRGLELTTRHGYTLFGYQFRAFLGLVAAARGDHEAAAGHRIALESWAGPRGIGFLTNYANAIGALSALGAGDYETAYRFATTVTTPGTFTPYVQQAHRTLLDLVEAALHSGRPDEARQHALAARDAGLPDISPRLALLTAGALAMTSEEPDFDAALALPGAALFPFDSNRVRFAYGTWLRRVRRPAHARDQLSRAAEGFERIGAQGWAERARTELRAAGASFKTGAPVVLTVQERQIAELAAGGLTNKEIGTRLYLSPRTVGSHLYRIFPKLGITSRAALRDALERLEVQSSD